MKRFKVGLLPASADLYNRLLPELNDSYRKMVNCFAKQLEDKFNFSVSDITSTKSGVYKAIEKFESSHVDLLVVLLGPYCPSGVLAQPLSHTNLPVVLWPIQSTAVIDPDKFSFEKIKLSHGVHAVQDNAGMLLKFNKPFAVLHKQLGQADFIEEFADLALAGSIYNCFRNSNPIQIGGHFQDMLDLQIADAAFLEKIKLKPRLISAEAFANKLKHVKNTEIELIQQCKQKYSAEYNIDPAIDDDILIKTAVAETALRKLLCENKSKACGINFLTLCNYPSVSDALHVPASVIMKDGFGYAAEGDWVTAAMVYALSNNFNDAGFSEMFSVCYQTNRILLRHWGEGNPKLAVDRVYIKKSQFTDQHKAEFLITDFHFKPASASLVNLSAASDGRGQLIVVKGRIDDTKLNRTDGPRALFVPDNNDIADVLDRYAYNGGSHHLTLVYSPVEKVLKKLSLLSGWKIIYI